MIGPFLYAQLYLQELHSSKPELKLPSSALSPVIDPHVSPDGTMLAYIRDSELHVLNLLYNESKQLTHGAQGNTVVSFQLFVFIGCQIIFYFICDLC
jgi:dipeptidyl-peptidase-4